MCADAMCAANWSRLSRPVPCLGFVWAESTNYIILARGQASNDKIHPNITLQSQCRRVRLHRFRLNSSIFAACPQIWFKAWFRFLQINFLKNLNSPIIINWNSSCFVEIEFLEGISAFYIDNAILCSQRNVAFRNTVDISLLWTYFPYDHKRLAPRRRIWAATWFTGARHTSALP
jgi:hypothetical protein